MILEQPGHVSTTINQSYDTFTSVAEEYGIKPPSKASFRLCIDSLEKLGIISHAVGVIDEGRGRRAKISLYDIPAQILVERVENVLKSSYNN